MSSAPAGQLVTDREQEPFDPIDLSEVGEWRAPLLLGAEWAEVRRMTLEQAVAVAMGAEL